MQKLGAKRTRLLHLYFSGIATESRGSELRVTPSGILSAAAFQAERRACPELLGGGISL
jgi:hypothetical protein